MEENYHSIMGGACTPVPAIAVPIPLHMLLGHEFDIQYWQPNSIQVSGADTATMQPQSKQTKIPLL